MNKGLYLIEEYSLGKINELKVIIADKDKEYQRCLRNNQYDKTATLDDELTILVSELSMRRTYLEKINNTILTITELEDMIGKPVYMKTVCEHTLAFAKRNNIDDDKLFKWVIVDKQLIIEYQNCNGFELYRYEC